MTDLGKSWYVSASKEKYCVFKKKKDGEKIISPQNLCDFISLMLDESYFFGEKAQISCCWVDTEAENSHLSLLSESRENSDAPDDSAGHLEIIW